MVMIMIMIMLMLVIMIMVMVMIMIMIMTVIVIMIIIIINTLFKEGCLFMAKGYHVKENYYIKENVQMPTCGSLSPKCIHSSQSLGYMYIPFVATEFHQSTIKSTVYIMS